MFLRRRCCRYVFSFFLGGGRARVILIGPLVNVDMMSPTAPLTLGGAHNVSVMGAGMRGLIYLRSERGGT